MNSRLDTIQATILLAKLGRLEDWNAARRRAAERYAELLADHPGIRVPRSRPGNTDVWHLYVVQVADRDRVLAELGAAGVGASIHYPTPLHLTEAYGDLGYRAGEFPVAERAASRLLSLPIYPHLGPSAQDRVVEVLTTAVTR